MAWFLICIHLVARFHKPDRVRSIEGEEVVDGLCLVVSLGLELPRGQVKGRSVYCMVVSLVLELSDCELAGALAGIVRSFRPWLVSFRSW